MNEFWSLLAPLGALIPTSILAAAATIAFFLQGSWKDAFLWSMSYTIAVALVAVTKIAYFGWGSESGEFSALSGHAARAAAVYPMLTYVITAGLNRRLAFGAMLAAALIAVFAASAQVALGSHTIPEVVLGALLGASVPALIIARRRRAGTLTAVKRVSVLLVAVLFAAVSLKFRYDFEQILREVAVQLSGRATP